MSASEAERIAGELGAEEREALLIAARATYAPGELAARLRSDGEHSLSGWRASRMLDRMAASGLVRFDRVVGPESRNDIRARGHIDAKPQRTISSPT